MKVTKNMLDVIQIIRINGKMKFNCIMRYNNCKGTGQKSTSVGAKPCQKDLPGQSIGHTQTKLLQLKMDMMFKRLKKIIEKAEIGIQIK